MNLSSLRKSKAKHVLVFGPPKSGKTLLVGKLAEAGFKLKWFDLENGRNTLFQLSQEAQERIDMFPIPDTRSFPIAADTITTVLKGVGKTRICLEHGKTSCAICTKSSPEDFSEIILKEMKDDEILVIDSLTQLSNSVMFHETRNKPDDFTPGWDEYKAQGRNLTFCLSEIQNASFNCVVITHEAGIEQEDGKEKLIPIGGTRNFARTVARYFDEVIYCHVKNRRHVAASSSLYEPNILTGSRTGVAIEKDAEASLLKIFQDVSSSKKESQGEALMKDISNTLQNKQKE